MAARVSMVRDMGDAGLSKARYDAHHRLLVIPEPHAFVEPVGAGVLPHDMQERDLVPPQLPANQLHHQAACESTPLELGMCTDAADLAQRARAHALARHGNQAPVLEAAEVLAQL